MKHKFTLSECKRCGKLRAKQKAAERRNNPTEAEQFFREVLNNPIFNTLGIERIEYEYPIRVGEDLELYMDIMFWINEWTAIAIEVDGSKSWHEPNTKSAPYDELKARYCNEHNILLVYMQYSRWKKLDMWQVAVYIMEQISKFWPE